MSVTLNDIFDGLEATLATAEGLRAAYSEVEEATVEPSISGMALVSDTANDNRDRLAVIVLEVSVSADDRSWKRALRITRGLLSSVGAPSLPLLIRNTRNLGVTGVSSALVTTVGNERTLLFSDGRRWVSDITVEVVYNPNG